MNRQLGCGTLGLGCMGMVNPERNEDYVQVIHAALDAGITFFNTGDFYGHGKSEMAVGEALKGKKRENAYVSVKFGVMREPNGRLYGLDVRPDSIKNYLTYTLSRLHIDYIDLYQPARMDEAIPVEEVIGAISELVEALTEIANEKQVSLPQLAIAWLLHQDENIVTLVGASKLASLHDSMGAVDVHLDQSDLKRIEDAIPPEKIAGSSMPKTTFRNGKLS